MRSWLASTQVREHDARSVLRFSAAEVSLRKLIAGEGLSTEDIVSFGRLNSFCVAQWYEPFVDLVREPFIDPSVAEFLKPLVSEE